MNKIIFGLCLVTYLYIRTKYTRHLKKKRVVARVKEYYIAPCMFLASIFLPTAWICGLFDKWNYEADIGLTLFGAGFYGVGLKLMHEAHEELGKNFSPWLEVFEDHVKVKTGWYRVLKHPMYASYLILAAGQMCLINNWFIAPLYMIAWLAFFPYRVRREEKLMSTLVD